MAAWTQRDGQSKKCAKLAKQSDYVHTNVIFVAVGTWANPMQKSSSRFERNEREINMIQLEPGVWIKFDGCKIVGTSETKLTPGQAKAAREAAQGQKTGKRQHGGGNQAKEATK